MAKTLIRAVLCFALLAGVARAADTKLAVLQAVPAATKTTFNIVAKPGPQSPPAPTAAETWRITAAQPLKASARPADRIIELYTGTGAAPILFCRVVVRFQPDPKGWVAYFQLDEEPLVARVNGRWQPVQLAPGVTAQLVQKMESMPTADGFYPAVEFGLATGSLVIVGWVVR